MCPVGADWALPLLTLLVAASLFVPAAPSAAQETWTPTNTVGAPSARDSHTAVWTGSKMVIWGGYVGSPAFLDSGAVYDSGTDTWAPTGMTGAPSARMDHTAVWTGSKMIIWGGSADTFLNSGAVYDPATDTWTPTSTVGAPSARAIHSAVWTGSKMIVWGGLDASYANVNTGGIYDPRTDTWTATSTTNAPTIREAPTAVWTGSKMIVWGGLAWPANYWNTGGIYDPGTDTWTATSTTNAPTARAHHTGVWTGSEMIVWGGSNYGGSGATTYYGTGGIYDPGTDTWTAMSTTNAPAARHRHAAVWTGLKMVLWGGYVGNPTYLYLNSGAAYDSATHTWTPTSTIGAPAARHDHTAVWTGSKTIVWGGRTETGDTKTGGVYSNPAVLPPPPLPAEFFTVTPCRVADTRNAAGPTGGPALAAGATRNFPVTGGVCGIPSAATAVSVNLTVTQPAAQGYLTLYPGDAAGPPLVSNINFTPGVTRANNAIVLLATNGGTINVTNGSAGLVHFVLDVTGYFQ